MTSIRFVLASSVAALTLILANLSLAQTTAAPPEASAVSADMAEGEIRKVDKEGMKLTIRHGPLKNLDMPGMTMVFQVQDPAMLEAVQSGDKVRFVADKVDGKFTVTRMEVSR